MSRTCDNSKCFSTRNENNPESYHNKARSLASIRFIQQDGMLFEPKGRTAKKRSKEEDIGETKSPSMRAAEIKMTAMPSASWAFSKTCLFPKIQTPHGVAPTARLS